jgi:hypothetical protein
LVIAEDDPHRAMFEQMALLGLQDQGGVCDVRIVPAVGCEKFSELAYKEMDKILKTYQRGQAYTLPNGKIFECRYPVGQGVKLRSVEVFEHNANSAVYEG